MKPGLFDVLVLVLTVAIVYVMVRPQSKGAELINAITTALTAIVRSAVDLAGG
jgi:hypothetical protein